MNRIKNNKKILVLLGVITLVAIIFVSMNFLQTNNAITPIYSPQKTIQNPISISAITNVTDVNLTVLYPANLQRFYINSSNGFGSGTVENLKNETKTVSVAELYPSTDYGNVTLEVSFDTTGVDINSMTKFRINWQEMVLSTASSVIETKCNIYIDNQGSWNLLHNATNAGGNIIDRKIGWWEHEITTNFLDYVSSDTITLKFEGEQTLTAPETNWFLYLYLDWATIVFEKNVEFVRINASSFNLVYNDTKYQTSGSIGALVEDEDNDVLKIKLNETGTAGRNNITFDLHFDLGNFSLDDIYGFRYCHDDWFLYQSGSPPLEKGTINIRNTSSNKLMPILHLRIPHISYNNLYPKQGFAKYTVLGDIWWNTSEIKLRYYRNVTGVSGWVAIEMDVGYIEIVRRVSPIFSVIFENTTKYIEEIELVNIFVQNYRSNVTSIRVFHIRGEEFINDTEGNYTFEVTRDTSGWYNFSVQIIDTEENLVKKGNYSIWFKPRPVNIDITLSPIPEKIGVFLYFTDLVHAEPVPNRQFDLLIFKFGETTPYQSYPGLSTNSSGMFENSYSVVPYLDETYTFNITSCADESYDRSSAVSSVLCSYAPPLITITKVDYSSEYAGEDVTIYYHLEDWGQNILSAVLRENGQFLINLPTAGGSHQVTFKGQYGNNNYTIWSINEDGHIGESEVVNLNLKLMPIKMELLTFYIDDFYYFVVNVMDNETRTSLDGVPVRVTIYDSGFMLFTGTVVTHSVIFGGVPFDQGMDHFFSFKAQIMSENYVNLERESQIPFKSYPLEEFLTIGIPTPILFGLLVIFRFKGSKWKCKRRNRRQ